MANRIDVYQYLVDRSKALPQTKTVESYEALLPWNLSKRIPEKNQ